MPRIGTSKPNIPIKKMHPMRRIEKDLRLDTIPPLNFIM